MITISDYTKKHFKKIKIRVGSSTLTLKKINIESEVVIFNFRENIDDFFPIALLLYDEKSDDVIEAYSAVCPRIDDEDITTYQHRLNQTIARQTFDTLFSFSNVYEHTYRKNVEKGLKQTMDLYKSNAFTPHRDLLSFMVNNFGYNFSNLLKMESDELHSLFLLECVSRGDVSAFVFLLSELRSIYCEFHEENSEYIISESYVEQCISLINFFSKNQIYEKPEVIKGQIQKLLSDLKINFNVTGTIVNEKGRGNLSAGLFANNDELKNLLDD